MDPVSLALGITGLVPLIAKAVQYAKEYSSAVRTAKDAIATLVAELEALQFSTINLHEFLKTDALAPNDLWFH
jgi:hypothetical protein